VTGGFPVLKRILHFFDPEESPVLAFSMGMVMLYTDNQMDMSKRLQDARFLEAAAHLAGRDKDPAQESGRQAKGFHLSCQPGMDRFLKVCSGWQLQVSQDLPATAK
jgi:hypothetical protein